MAPYIDKDSNETTTYARELDWDYEKYKIYYNFIYGLNYLPIEDYIQLGEEYKKAGGFFEIIEAQVDEAFIKNNAYTTLYEIYILNYFIDELKLSSGSSEEELKFLLSKNRLSYFIGEYFAPVNEPLDEDLVIYENYWGEIKYAGIYKSGNNLPPEGTVQSVVQFINEAGLFQHDVFFIPGIMYKDFKTAKFFRIKSECPSYEAILTLWEKGKDKFQQTYTVNEEGEYRFNKTEDNLALRKKISNLHGKDLLKEFPEILSLRHIDAFGVCSHYAFRSILDRIPEGVTNLNEEQLNKLLDKYFTPQQTPEIGDLVVYYNATSHPVHYGVYYADEIVESKWGEGDVHMHPIFYVDNIYGNRVKFFKPKPKPQAPSKEE